MSGLFRRSGHRVSRCVIHTVGQVERTVDCRVVGVTLVHRWPEISLQPSRVVTQAAIRTGLSAVQATDGTKVDGHVGEWPGGDETAAHTRWKRDITTTNTRRRHNHRTRMRRIRAIATQ